MLKKIAMISAPIILYVSLMIVFAFYDLNISLFLLNQESIFAKIFETSAEVPFTLLALLSFSTLFLTRNKTVKWKNIVTSIISIIGILAYSFLILFFVLNYLKVSHAWIYGLSFTLPISVLALYCMRLLTKKYSNEMKTIAIIAILTILIEQVLINAIKYSWGRPRMRELVYPYDDFKPWYIPSFFSGHDSFPSGHSANASCIILITLLPATFFKHKKTGYILTNLISYAWIITVMISRVIQGAHFASDVLTGSMITLTTFYLLKYNLYPKLQGDVQTN